MSMQVLQGVTIKPRGAKNQARWSSSLVNGSWPTSFAFGSWIYSTNCEIGFSEKPTELRISCVLETIDKAQKYAAFDINDNDLDCSAGNGGEENLFDININGVLLSSFILYSYDISIENSVKILNITFKDYSIILDKIYVGLIKRQGWTFPHTAKSKLSFNVRCPDCILMGNSFTQEGIVYRDIAFGSYVGINGKTFDNFINTDPTIDIFSQWMALFQNQTNSFPNKFDLNGGFLIIGTEEATEERCGNLANVSYNFNELLASLRVRGLNFTGAFPYGQTDSDFIYKQNYNGTLREVLQQWCSDLGYSFYCDGKNFVGLSLTKPLDISSVIQIADPTTTFGADFSTNSNSAILSYKSTSSLENTFTQSVITENNRVRDVRVDSKTPKRYVGILPLHPLDFNIRNQKTVIRQNALGIPFFDIAWAHSFERNSADLQETFSLLDNRTFDDTDTAIALGRYNSNLRDIFCQDRAIYGETAEIRASNFRALGYVPLVEITGQEMTWIIDNMIPEEDSVSDICKDKRFYRAYFGYSYREFKDEVLGWERDAADAMYKYGIITEGMLNYFPYMPQNSLTDQSPTGGFYGDSGTSLLRTQHSYKPDCRQYYQLRDTPFSNIIINSGLLTNDAWADANYSYNNENGLGLGIPVLMPTGGVFPGGLFYGDLTNSWGTDVEDFQRIMSMNLTDQCVESFQQEQSFTNINNGINTQRQQDWRLEKFVPMSTDKIDDFVQTNQAVFQKLLPVYSTLLGNVTGSIYDRVINTYYDLRYKKKAACSKLHLILLTDTRNHPNISVDIKKYGTEFVNPMVLRSWVDLQREAIKGRIQTETQSICSISLLQEMCKNIISGQYKSGTGDARYRCIIDEDKYNFLEEAYPLSTLLAPNSRGLNINIVKNPIRNSSTDNLQATFANSDINGDFYYSDIVSNFLQMKQTSVNLNIIYPISFGSQANYRGILTSQVDLENRIPEIINILGTPVNIINNRAATMKVINNAVDPDLQPQLDPFYQRFVPYMTVISGTGNVITTPEQYHNLISQLNSYQLTGAYKTVDLTLAGTPDFFGNFSGYLSPIYGMNKMSISVGDAGVTTSLSFSDRPPKLPRAESILNKISARIKK
jgi:hypothetical protein